jgi:hypothetical protein
VKEDMSGFLGKSSPGVGIYNPLKGSIEDKMILWQIRSNRNFAADGCSPLNSSFI